MRTEKTAHGPQGLILGVRKAPPKHYAPARRADAPRVPSGHGYTVRAHSDAQIIVKCTDVEKARWKAAAAAEPGGTLSEWVRKLANAAAPDVGRSNAARRRRT